MFHCLAAGLLTFPFSASTSLPAFGGQFEDAQAAYARGNYATDNRLVRPLAEQRNVDVQFQFHLGTLYFFGQGIPKNHAEGLTW